MLTPQILFRPDITTQSEMIIASKHFPVVKSRTKCSLNWVIGRYSVLPFYYELEQDLKYNNCQLINSFDQHQWIANFDYYDILKDYTPRSWRQHEFPYSNYEGPFVVKGCTNSKKDRWKTHMFAENRKQAIEVANRIYEDSYYGTQDLIYREFIPLKVLEYGLTGIPFSNEWRFFFYKDIILSFGYYWSIAEKSEEYHNEMMNVDGIDFAQKLSSICKNYCNFYVMDIAQKVNHEWILIELNDGQMSGLSMNEPELLYSNLRREIHKDET